MEDASGTQLAVLYTVEPLYRGHLLGQLAVLYREVALIQR